MERTFELDLREYDDFQEIYQQDKWSPPTEQIPAMSEELQDWLMLTKDDGNPVYNSDKLRLVDYREKNGVLEVQLGLTDYHTHVAARELEEPDLGVRPNTLSVGALLETSEGYTITGKKSDVNEIGAGEYSIPSGLADVTGNRQQSLKEQTYREIEEEINLPEDMITDLTPGALIESMNHMHLIFEGETDQSFSETANRWFESENIEFSQIAGLKEDHTVYAKVEDSEIETYTEITTPSLRPHAEKAINFLK